MITDRGCSDLEPGIGNIAYVKDLLTDTVVSSTFECSIFGGVQSSGQLGWVSYILIHCLQLPFPSSDSLKFD